MRTFFPPGIVIQAQQRGVVVTIAVLHSQTHLHKHKQWNLMGKRVAGLYLMDESALDGPSYVRHSVRHEDSQCQDDAT
jgi:hypothetical protein